MSKRTRPTRPPGPLRRAWCRFLDRTIWGKNSQPPGEKDYHLVAQLDLPVYDFLIGVFAVLGVIYTVPAIELVWGVHVVHVVTFLLLSSVSVAMLALIFRAQVIEFWAKIVLILTLISYPASTAALALSDVGNRQAIVFLLFALIVVPAGRVRYLLLKMLKRRDVKKAIQAITAELPIQGDSRGTE